MKNNIKIALLFLLLLIFTITTASFAADVSKPSASSKVQAKPLTAQQLPKIIKIDKSLVTLPKEEKQLPQLFYSAWKNVDDYKSQTALWILTYENNMKKYHAKCEECTGKNYTTADQTAAGCVATDTLASCSTKLYNHCIKTALADANSAKMGLKYQIKKMRDNADAMLNNIPN